MLSLSTIFYYLKLTRIIDEFLEPSDEEVLAEAEEPSDVSDDNLAPPEDEELEDWGSSKQDYYNADIIETEADAKEEEAEAIRLQKKHLQRLTEADFGFDESEWLEGENEDEDDEGNQRGVVQEILPQLEISDSMGPEERTKILKIRYPEFEPLAEEFVQISALHDKLRREAEATEAHSHSHADSQLDMNPKSKVSQITFAKFCAASAYLGALSMYFAILSSGPEDDNGKRQAMPPIELRDHPIMNTLVECRELWRKAKDVSVPEPSETVARSQQGSVEPEIDATQDQSQQPVEPKLSEQPSEATRKKPRKSKAQLAAEAALIEANNIRAERIRQAEESFKQLSNLEPASSRSSKLAETLHVPDQDDSDFGEETTLAEHEAVEKARRKKTLQFYTSQIAQKVNKRGNASRDAGGDADLPYRERFRDKQMRLNAEAEAKGKKKNISQTEALGGESDEEDIKTANEVRDKDSDEEYYDLVTAQSQKKKADKAARAAAYEQAAKEGGTVRVIEEIAPSGKRAISYQIEKNKGLIPKRNKDVRNPRVKKRKKYEEKKKKLGSIRPIYKGGEGRGGYGGELTGIKSGLIRSVKL